MSSMSALSQVSKPRKTSGFELSIISHRTSFFALMLWMLACRILRDGGFLTGAVVDDFLGEEVWIGDQIGNDSLLLAEQLEMESR